MDESRNGTVPAARRGWRIRGRLSGLGLGLVGILLTVAERGVAQDRWHPPGSTWGNPPEPFRLTVRPEMATGTHTLRAGDYLLDQGAPAASERMPYDAVVVPEQCVGSRRCPLVVWFGDTGPSSGDGPASSADFLFESMHPLAERYGMIFLAPRYGEEGDHAANLGYLDAALQYVLQHFAIDPGKIAIAGRDGSWAGAVGINNLDVFSRINTNFSPKLPQVSAIPDMQPRPQPKQPVEYLYSVDFGSVDLSSNPLRDRGFRLKWVIHFHLHEMREENFAFTAHWLHESWTYPDPATRPKPPVMTTPPQLTPRALTQLTTFWTRFLQEPDSICQVARQAHLREVAVQLGKEQVSAWLTDMPALAAKYPSVAAALEAAGLSAEQHDAYRLALLGAYVLADYPVPPEASPALAKNVEFVLGDEGKKELEELWATKMFRYP